MAKDLEKRGAMGALAIVPQGDIRAIIAENLGDGITANDLDRVKIPSGGGLAFEVPTLEGGEMEKSIEGVIVHHQDQNAYWSSPIESGSHMPPDCASRDGKYGDGELGGLCAVCPLNKFGTDLKNGRGKACKNIKVLFILEPGKLLPMAVFLPPTSIPVVKKYLLQLTSSGVPFYGVYSRLSLVKDKNADGTEFSKLAISPVVQDADASGAARLVLPEATVAGIKAYREAIIPVLSAVAADAEVMAGNAE